MNIIRVSATAARNNFFELLNQVALGARVVVEKDAKEVAKIIPMTDAKSRYKGLTKALEQAAKGFVYSRKDNPLRRKGSTDFLGKWDRK